MLRVFKSRKVDDSIKIEMFKSIENSEKKLIELINEAKIAFNREYTTLNRRVNVVSDDVAKNKSSKLVIENLLKVLIDIERSNNKILKLMEDEYSNAPKPSTASSSNSDKADTPIIVLSDFIIEVISNKIVKILVPIVVAIIFSIYEFLKSHIN